LECNPGLTKLIAERIGPDFQDNVDLLTQLDKHADDPGFQEQFAAIKRANKVRLTEVIKDRLNFSVSPDALFDVHVKRIHEYKRQLLNVLEAIALYQELKAHPNDEAVPRVKII